MIVRLRDSTESYSGALTFGELSDMDTTNQFHTLLTGSPLLDGAIDLSVRIFLKIADRLIIETGYHTL